jgi:hypothetical protein
VPNNIYIILEDASTTLPHAAILDTFLSRSPLIPPPPLSAQPHLTLTSLSLSLSLRKESGLPFYDVILNPDLPRGSSNPVSTVQQVKKRFQSGEYDFDYMFFTESDQV